MFPFSWFASEPAARPQHSAERLLLLAIGVLLLSTLLLSHFIFAFSKAQHFTHLAQAFLNGQLALLQDPGINWYDTALYGARHYLPLGPFPAILLLPFVYVFGFMGWFFYQGYLQFWLVVGTVCLVASLVRRLSFSALDTAYLTLAFVTSAFLGVALFSSYAYFSQVVAVLCLLLAIHEYLGSKRYWLIGLYTALALSTRLTAGLSALFYIIVLWFGPGLGFRQRITGLIQLLAPILVVALGLALYNYARFGNVLEQGYALQLVPLGALAQARSYGLLSWIHIPGNLYYLLLSVPQPVFLDSLTHILRYPFIKLNPWGMSIFVTSPYLLYLFGLRYRDFVSRALLVAVVVILLPLLLYYGIGYWQFGYRYALDFFPLLFWLLLREYRTAHGELTPTFRWVILGSALVNIYLITTYDYAIPI